MYSGIRYLLLKPVIEVPGPRESDVLTTDFEGGLPHSEIRGSKLVRSSPRLIAAYHVLHRLRVPRHPPNALKALDRSHCRYPLDAGENPTRTASSATPRTAAANSASPSSRRRAGPFRFRGGTGLERPVSHENCPKAEAVTLSAGLRSTPRGAPGQLFSSRCQRRRASARRKSENGSQAPENVRRLPTGFWFLISLVFADARRLVEPDGIEPTTSCLQSRRSPN